MANPLPSIGVDQPPFGGDSYPLVDPPAAAAGILADLYLAYVESSSPYALPLRVAWMYGFGDQVVSPPAGYPTPAHDRDLLIVDDLGRTVFDSTQAEDYFEDAWGSHYRIIEWRNGRQILRVVQRLGSAANTDQYLTPAAVINARAIKRIRPQLTGLLVNEQLVDAAEIVLAAGYNMRLDVERLPVVEGRKRVTRITLNAIPGEGEGRFPECSGDNRYLRSLMGQRPDGRGHLVLSGDECYRVTVPYEVVDGVAQVTPHTLKIVNDCTPCADCNDHIRVYRAVSNIHDQQAATYVQLDETRAAHQENIARWNAQKACREQRNQRLVVVSQEGGVVAVAGAFSNTTEECLWDVEFRFTFRVLNGGSPVPPANRQPNLVAGSTHAGGTNLDGTVPYSLGGTWPAWFTRYDQVASGDTNFVRFGLTFTPEPGDALEVTFTTHSPHGAGIGLPAVGVSGAIEDLWTTTPNGPAIAVTKRLVPLYPGTPGSPGGGSGGPVPEHTHSMADVENLVEALAGKANVIHSHAMEDVSGLDDALAGKANVSHGHAMEDVSGLDDALAGKANVSHGHTMADVSGLDDALAGKANVSHGHAMEDVSGLGDALAGKANVIHSHAMEDVSGLGDALAGKANVIHSHTMADVENLVEALAGKANVNHGHSMADVSGLDDALAGKANVSHGHAISDVTGLQTALDGKASATHSHAISDVTGLQTALDGKANVGHGHEIEDIDGLEDILTGKANVSHGHAIEDVSGLHDALAGKANVSHGHAAADVTSGTFDDARIAQSSVTQHQGAIDHGSIGGLNDDDHGHYALKDGTRWTSTQTANRVAISDANGHLVCSDITTTELDALDGIEGNIETRIKALENAGGGSPGGFDPNCVIVSDGSGNLVASSITTTELGHLDGVSSNIQTQLDGKSDTGHGHDISDITGLSSALDGKADSSHGHTIADVAGLQTALDAKAASSHGHAIADVTGLADALDGKAASSHGHAISDVTGLQTALAGKANVSHGHAIADVAGLQTALAGKANVSHGHAIADVTGLQTALAGKANVSHGHAIADVTGLQTSLDAIDGALAAALTKAVNTVTTSGSLTTANRTILANNSAAITLNLPPAATMAGDYLIVKKISNNAHTVTLDPNGSETIDGATTYVLYVVGDYVIIQSDGSNWRVIGGYALPHQCVMRRTTAKSIASTTITLIDGLTVMADTAALAGTDKIVIRRTGRYLIVVSGDGPTFSTSDIWQIYAYRGAAAYGTASATGAAIATTSALSGVFAANLTAGDEITLRALQYNPGTDARDLSNATLAVLEQR